MITSADRQWMQRALDLAALGLGTTAPNPMVGAVVVRDGRLIAEGWHRGPGLPHAEVVALDYAGAEAQGATLYVTLEPCSHHGRTPPCTDRILTSGIRRVVAAMQDPNPLVNGRGFEILRAAGVDVVEGVLKEEAAHLNRAFVTWVTKKRPYVHLKLAQSLDGRAATRTGDSKWITGEKARLDAHRLRARVGAIVAGIGTVLADNPLLTARPNSQDNVRQPLRVILDSRARTPPGAQCLETEKGRVLVAATRHAPQERLAALEALGAGIWIDPGKGDRVDLDELMKHLAAEEITEVLIEGGPTVAGAFVDRRLVDEVTVYTAPLLIGGAGARGSLGGVGAGRLEDALKLKNVAWERLGEDFKITGVTA